MKKELALWYDITRVLMQDTEPVSNRASELRNLQSPLLATLEECNEPAEDTDLFAEIVLKDIRPRILDMIANPASAGKHSQFILPLPKS